MNNIQEYLARANRGINEAFIGVDGQFDNFAGDPNSWFGANGAAPAVAPVAPASQSMPYIITASNASNGSVSVDLFGAFIYLSNAGWSNGSLVVNNVTISSNIANVTYQQLLYQSQASPFQIAQTLITSIAGISSQVQQPINLVTQDANGMLAQKVLTPTIDPYQTQSGSILLKQGFSIDGYTKLNFNLFANSSVQFLFYPADTINLARGLNGVPVSKQFVNPDIIRPAVR